jgi:hypothetical protein
LSQADQMFLSSSDQAELGAEYNTCHSSEVM